ncbi:TBC1 domain family member 30-like isoform X1 [Panonychus citri]|uniref:TBC1 domain family member 30-like isoform X1 n=1 Tax=Panonychus citri TaxID=50023 RepID=UPI002307C5A6|nr:TBC1 domain family member 30-like isoform X1 [Panonychus citri]
MTSPSCSSFQSPITTNGSSSLVWEDIPLDSECVVNQDDKSTKRNVNCYVNYDEVNNNWNRNNHFVKDENDLDDDDDEDDDDTLYFEESASEYRTPPGSPKLFYSSDETINKSLYQHSDSFHGQSSLPLGNHFRSNSIGGCNESLKLSYRKKGRTGSLVDQLLNDIHFTLRKTDHRRTSRCSDTSSLSPPDFTYRLPHIRKANLLAKDISELQVLLSTLECDIKRMNSILLHHLKKKDRLHFQRGQLFDIITAALQAISPKRLDTKMRFSIEPSPGDSGFNQWHDAMRMVARLPGGIPNEFRKKLWLTLSERFIESRNINWSKTSKFCFNEKCNPEDDSLGTQIVKDLHRTGCSMFSGADSEHNQALLKQVLLAYARWNRGVGYCQGFNMLAAIILEVMDWDVDNSLKVMIYLIEGVLPTSYFANNLRGLSVDMATFRDLLRLRLPELSKHLDKLQNQAADTSTGASYEPPLVNVFTMQWFLTLFSNCLPKPLVLRIWDLIFLEGNEILIRTALVIWDCLQDRIINVESADEFYSIMGVLTREMMEFGVRDTNELVKTICTMAPFPFPQLADIREKYTFNIRPLTSLVKKGVNLFYSDEEEDDSTTDTIMVASWCLSNGLTNEKSRERSGSRATSPSTLDGFSNSLSMIGSTIGSNSTNFLSSANIDPQRMSLDISLLKKQYMKLKERQRQAHIILIEGFQNAQSNSVTKKQSMTVNHLLQGKTALIAKRPRKPCSVRQPTIGSAIGVGIIGGGRSTVVTGTNNVGRCPVSKKCLSERSKTVADLDPLLKSAKVTLEEKGKESGETLHWNDLRIERKKNRITRKLSEPSLSVCREHEESEFPEDEEDEESNEPEVAFIGYSSSAKLNSKANEELENQLNH